MVCILDLEEAETTQAWVVEQVSRGVRSRGVEYSIMPFPVPLTYLVITNINHITNCLGRRISAIA